MRVQQYRFENGLYSTRDPLSVARALAGVLQTDPDIQWISYSEEATGRFMGARRLEGTEFILNLSDPRQSGGVPREFRADTLAPYQSPTPFEHAYDPRTLDWYRRAVAQPGTLVWMPPYLFTEGVKGLTVAAAARGASGQVLGVVTVDLALAGITSFLRTVKVGTHGVVVLFDRNGEPLTAASGPGLDAATRAVKNWGRIRGGGAARHAAVVIDGETWEVVARTFTRGDGFQWTAAVAVPEEDFMGAVNATRRTAIAIALGGIALAIVIGALLSTRMARSVGDATDALDRVARFDLSGRSARPSRLLEIARLQQAVSRVTARRARRGGSPGLSRAVAAPPIARRRWCRTRSR